MLPIVALVVLFLLVSPPLCRIAISAGLVDRPSGRKRHVGEVPLVGGIGIYLCLLVSLAMPMGGHLPPVLLALGGAILLMGFIDDKLDLGARVRFVLQLLIALAMVLAGDVRIESIGSILGGDPLLMHGWVSVVFSVVCIVGVINAINMIDGLDGLSGGILLSSFAALAWLATSAGRMEDAYALSAVCALLAAFLWLNSRLFRPRATLFLGDSGSMLLGLILSWYVISLTQAGTQPVAMSPVAAGWIFGLPLLETVAVMVGRMIERRSPFEAGRDHLHHRLRARGYSVGISVALMVAVHTLFVVTGLLAPVDGSRDALLFWCFVAIVLLQVLVIQGSKQIEWAMDTLQRRHARTESLVDLGNDSSKTE